MTKKTKTNSEISQALQDLMETQGQMRTRTISKKPTGKNSEVIAIRVDKEDKEKLSKHFKMKGLISLSVGIRQLIYKYMDDNNLL